jgi:hypothetical protein
MVADLFPLHTDPHSYSCVGVDDAIHGGVKVGSNNLGGGNVFDPMSAAARFYWPHQHLTCRHRTALHGHDTVLVDEDL